MNGSLAEPASLDTVDYDPINHLNLLFSHPSTVSSIGQLSSVLQASQNELSRDISSLETAQAYYQPQPIAPGPSSASSPALPMSPTTAAAAQAELASLFGRVSGLRARASTTERDITGMTADIKRLDGTKRNLTLSMTALKRLQMLTTAYEQLRSLARARQYRDCAGLLQAVLQLMRHFSGYRGIEQIAALGRGVSDLQRELLEQVCEDFELAFARGDIEGGAAGGGGVGARRQMLVEACAVVDALGDNARARLVGWYVNTELREYRRVFRGSDSEAGSLDNIGRRYAWFKRMLRTHEEEHAVIFPPHWRMGETLAAAFCDGTRDDFKAILERAMRRQTDAANRLDVNLLLSCLQETLDFEQSLEKRFAKNEPRASIDTLSSVDDRSGQSFNGSISVAFEPYLSLWVDSQDKALAAMMPKYKTQPLIAADDEFSPQAVIPSAIELFHFYKLTLSQCAKLSTSDRLLDLSRTFAKYLDEYAQQVLFGFLQRGGQQQGPPLQDVVLVLNTADFWHTNTGQLEENVAKRIDPELAHKVDLSPQADAFMGVASAAVLALVHKVELECEPAWREMKNTNWARMEGVGDQSSYVGELLRRVNAKAEEILAMVVKPQYARAFCDNLVEHVATAYIASLVACRPVSEVGAEQMLLDKYVLTKSFENLMSFHNKSGQHVPPASFVKRVNASMTRVDPLLKTLQVRPSPPEGLVQAYLIHIGDRSDTNFRKVLDLKGIRKQDQPHLLDMFAIHRDGPDNAARLVQNSPLLTPLMASSGLGSSGAINPAAALAAAGAAGAASSIMLPGLQKGAFADAATIGEKLLNAARDGVERMGTTTAAAGSAAGGGTAGAAGAASTDGAAGEKATLNENLKNIGKFFRRDIGGLGARFGAKRDGSADGT